MEMSVHSSPNISHIEEEEALDPRVQIELENLNAATNEINRLESALEEANNSFRASLNETSIQLQTLSKKLGVCVEKARPYYEAKERAKKLQFDCQRAAVQYQRANAVHQAARETIALAEERFANLKENSKERKFDSAWQEMLNHATMKIMEAEAQKSANEREHRKRAAAYTATEREVQELQNKLKTSINKSRPYFNHRAATQIKLEAQKDRIYKLQKDILMVKNKYSYTLRNLEQISEEIHELRRINMKREPGVGAEMDACEPFIEMAPSEERLTNSKVDEEQEYWNTLKKKIRELKDDKSVETPKKNKNEDESILVFKDSLSLSYQVTLNSPEKSHSDTRGPIEDNHVFCTEGNTKVIDNKDIDLRSRKVLDQEAECGDEEVISRCKSEQLCDTVSLSDIVMMDNDAEMSDQIKSEPCDQISSEPNLKVKSEQAKSELPDQIRSEPNGQVENFFLSEGKFEEETEERFPELKDFQDLSSGTNFVSNAVRKFETLAMTCTKAENKEIFNEKEGEAL